jgi:recombinational DNA repair protein (RecF pathway)
VLVIVEILDKLLPNNQTEAKVFHFLKSFLVKLSKRDLADTAIFTEIELLLSYLGYAFSKKESLSWLLIGNFLEQTGSRKLISSRL